MPTITIADLEVFFRVGVPDEERARPQRLLLTIEMECDFAEAASTDNLSKTIDYQAVSDLAKGFGEGRNWKLIERLAAELADAILEKFSPEKITIEVKKFIIPGTKYVSVTWEKKNSK